jgi:hypothetical protein
VLYETDPASCELEDDFSVVCLDEGPRATDSELEVELFVVVGPCAVPLETCPVPRGIETVDLIVVFVAALKETVEEER